MIVIDKSCPQIWCATGVNLTGGKTRDGGSVVGASVFYSNPPESESDRKEVKDEVDRLNQELKVQASYTQKLKEKGKVLSIYCKNLFFGVPMTAKRNQRLAGNLFCYASPENEEVIGSCNQLFKRN